MFAWMTSIRTPGRKSLDGEYDYYKLFLPMPDSLWCFMIYDYGELNLDWSFRVTNLDKYPRSTLQYHIDHHQLQRGWLSDNLQRSIIKYCFREDSLAGKE